MHQQPYLIYVPPLAKMSKCGQQADGCYLSNVILSVFTVYIYSKKTHRRIVLFLPPVPQAALEKSVRPDNAACLQEVGNSKMLVLLSGGDKFEC